jgi:hypothetical protein
MKTQRLILVLIVLLFSVSYPHRSVQAGNEAPPVTRWVSPIEISKPLHEPLREIQPLELHLLNQDRLRPPAVADANLGRICFVVNQDVLTDIDQSLEQYEGDLIRMGFDTIIYEYASGTAEALRTHLTALYQQPESLVGAVLIGNIPYVVYEMMQDFGAGDEYEDFPCDIFFMDLDGSWSDTLSDGSVQPSNGKYDTRGGNQDLEIWVSRLRTDNLSALGPESQLLNTYFDKNHRYRRKILIPGDEALVYNDDDWAYMALDDASHIEMIYDASVITTIFDPEETILSDYVANQLSAPYEFIFIRSHGYSGGHGFYRNAKSLFEFVYSHDYRQIDPTAVFYSLYVCSGADYTADNNLAGTIAFNNNDSGLLSIGSTKSGGMWNAFSFYSALANGSVFGEAFRQWFNNVQSSFPDYAPLYWYGMVLIGDGALTRSSFIVQPCEGDFDEDGDIDGADLEEFSKNPEAMDIEAFAARFGHSACYR